MRSEIPFSGGRGGGSARRATNRLMPSAPAKIGAVALVVLVVAGVGWAAFSSMRAPAFEVHADEAAAPSSSEPETVEVKAQVCVYVTASALETLSGVGSATAQAIISDREQNGPFSTIEDLMRVDGIGEKKFAKLKDSICV